MSRPLNRRKFLKNTAAGATVAATASLLSAPNILAQPAPNSKLNIAGIGVGGRGGSHLRSSLSENLVAVCDVVDGTVDGCLRHVQRH